VIDSLLGQDFDGIELLIGDNGSSDGTESIGRDAADRDPRVRYLPSPVNRGAAWNYNRLVDHARGELFKWAADDDTYQPSFVSRCVDVLDHDPGAVLCYSRAREIGPADEDLGQHQLLNTVCPAPTGRRFASALQEVYCYAVFGVMRTDVLRSTGRIGAFTSSDKVLLAELALHGHFCEIDEPLFNHREHDGRSMYEYADDRKRLVWFDPALAGRLTLPRWRLARGYLAAIRRAPIPVDEKLTAATPMFGWVRANGPVMARELVSTMVRPQHSIARDVDRSPGSIVT